MRCFHPKIVAVSPNENISVPCRRCIACRKLISSEWTTRLLHENLYHKESCFLTLTYRTEDLPKDRSLSKRVVQLFIKRLRKHLGDTKIKYYACGEYGDKYDREHYHLIVFGWNPPLEDLFIASRKKGKVYYGSRTISAIWPYGFNTVGLVSASSCRYTANYVQKKLYGERGRKILRGRLQPFALQSRGIGARYAHENREKIQNDLSTVSNGKDSGLPRYYARILGIDNKRLKTRGLIREGKKYAHYSDEGYSWNEYTKLGVTAREQEEKNATALERIVK